jgi:RNA polymerase sigma factor (sigma-70 family)
MPGESIDKILGRLNSGRVESAWKAFLKAYSPMIMQVALKYEIERDRANDCFLFVCEKLSDNGFRRLLQFDASRGVSFRAWLNSVVSNLCIDWYRREFGRARPCKAIAALPAFEGHVYQYKFKLGLNLEACFRALQLTYPDLTKSELARAISRVHSMLSPRQRWQLSFRRRETTSISELAEPGPGPDALAQLQQERAALLQAMSRLTHQQRLLLRLRYQEDLPLKEVARLAGLKDPFQARHQIESAVATLGKLLTPQKPAA